MNSGPEPLELPRLREAFILDAVRSPMGRGKEGGALSSVHPIDLLAQVIKTLVERTGYRRR